LSLALPLEVVRVCFVEEEMTAKYFNFKGKK